MEWNVMQPATLILFDFWFFDWNRNMIETYWNLPSSSVRWCFQMEIQMLKIHWIIKWKSIMMPVEIRPCHCHDCRDAFTQLMAAERGFPRFMAVNTQHGTIWHPRKESCSSCWAKLVWKMWTDSIYPSLSLSISQIIGHIYIWIYNSMYGLKQPSFLSAAGLKPFVARLKWNQPQ